MTNTQMNCTINTVAWTVLKNVVNFHSQFTKKQSFFCKALQNYIRYTPWQIFSFEISGQYRYVILTTEHSLLRKVNT
jgi:hypothetical protein